jgi:hypothetical protein
MALDNYIEHYYDGTAYYYNGEFHNEKPQLGNYYEVNFEKGILVKALSHPSPLGTRYPVYTEGCQYPVHVE